MEPEIIVLKINELKFVFGCEQNMKTMQLCVVLFRDDERQRVCLDIIYKMLSKLKPLELRELLPGVIGFISHPSPVCRERMYDIMMWIYDNYRYGFSYKYAFQPF